MTTYETTSFFGFVYKKSGGFAGVNDRISYESITKKLIFVDRSNKRNEKRLETQNEEKLKETISDNGFFEVDNFYHSGNMTDAYQYTLIATMDGQIQASHWTDDSEGKPEGLSKIASAIEEMAPR